MNGRTRSVQKEDDRVYKSLIAFIWSRKVELNNVVFGFVHSIVNKASFSVITFRSPTFLHALCIGIKLMHLQPKEKWKRPNII